MSASEPVAVSSPLYADRDLRQRQLVPPDRLASCHALVIGVGAIGRQVAMQLAALGVPAMDLIDFDLVSIENLAPQGYWPADLGQEKVQATADLCRCIHPEIELQTHAERFRRSLVKSLACLKAGQRKVVVFACVDSMDARKLLWESLAGRVSFFVDGRMSAEVVRVLASGDPGSERHYPTTLFSEEQVHTGACTAKSTIYSASIAAGFMLCQFTRWLRDLPVDSDVLLNLLSMEMSLTE
jgi:sulfur carrier protein ThiS adenylyltransferase